MRNRNKFSIRSYIFIVLGCLVFAIFGIATASSLSIGQGSEGNIQVLANDLSDDVLRDDRGYPPPGFATKTPRGFPTPTDEPDPYPDPPTPTPEPTEDPYPYPDPPTPTPEPTEDPYPYPDPPTPTPAPTQDPYPIGTKFHVFDLDVNQYRTEVLDGGWIAAVTVRLQTEDGHFLGDIAVEGYFSNRPNRIIRCENIGFNCLMESRVLNLGLQSVEFVVTHAEHNNPNTTYAPELNTDSDGDSDGNSIIIEQPDPDAYP